MTIRGHIENGVVVFDDPVLFADGTRVRVEIAESPRLPLAEQNKNVIGAGFDLPDDPARNSDRGLQAALSDSDVQVVSDCLSAGITYPPDVAHRIHELAEQARQQILAIHGVQNIGVQIFREIRGELPDS